MPEEWNHIPNHSLLYYLLHKVFVRFHIVYSNVIRNCIKYFLMRQLLSIISAITSVLSIS